MDGTIHFFPCSQVMKKTFFYDFIPSKAEEEAYRASHEPWQVSRLVVEARDVFPPPPPPDPSNPWQIRKALSHIEVVTGKVVAPFAETFNHVFRHWTLCMANQTVLGHQTGVVVLDVTDQNHPVGYCATFEILRTDDYVLVCMDLFRGRRLEIDDEIGLSWDCNGSTFKFKLLRRAPNNK